MSGPPPASDDAAPSPSTLTARVDAAEAAAAGEDTAAAVAALERLARVKVSKARTAERRE